MVQGLGFRVQGGDQRVDLIAASIHDEYDFGVS